MGKWKEPTKACRRGHEWEPGSYYVQRGYKHCKICRRARYWSKYREKNLARHERDRREIKESLELMKRKVA